MLQQPILGDDAGNGATRRKRRRGPATPVRRMRRIVAAGLCAGAAFVSGMSGAASAQQPNSAAQYYNAARSNAVHGGPHGAYAPYYAPCAPCTPYGAAPGHAPTPAGQAPTDAQGGADGQSPSSDFGSPPAATQNFAPAPSATSLTGASGSAAAPSSASPASIGDFFGTASQGTVAITVGLPPGPAVLYDVPSPAVNLAGRIKAAENNSPIPQDRVFLDYTYYHNVPLTEPNIDIQRFTPGFERTFLDGMMSVELRLPLARTLDNSFTVGETLDGDAWEVGNIYTSVKTLLYEDSQFALSAGLGVSAPTAHDLEFNVPGLAGEIENRSVHLLPYFGAQITPNDTFFGQAYIQVDVDANGNTVYANGNQVGRFQDQTFLYTDALMGAWLYDNPCSSSLRSVAGVVEAHYSTSVRDPDSLAFADGGANVTFTENDNDLNFLTGVVGLHLIYAGGARVTFGYGVPLANDRFSDGELRVMLNLGEPFGPLASLGR